VQLREAYLVLGVTARTGRTELKKRYRALVKAVHPDSSRIALHDDIGRIVEAYRIAARVAPIDATPAPRRAPAGVRTGEQRRASGDGRTPEGRGDGGRRATAARQRPPEQRRAHEQQRPPEQRDSQSARHDNPPRDHTAHVRAVFVTGQRATQAPDAATRVRAVRELGATQLRSAIVFLKQALFDGDRQVAVEAARQIVAIPGSRTEVTVIELFDQLAREQRLAILEAVIEHHLPFSRLVAIARADRDATVRARAKELSL
jgi:hypothetical protein